jgi:hypothetical protein
MAEGIMKKTGYYLFLVFISLLYVADTPVVCAQEHLEIYKKVKRQVPEYVFQKIQKNAADRYPGNERLQNHTIEVQQKAYFKVKEYKNDKIPSQELVMIVRNADREHPYDYVSQLIEIMKKAETYIQQHEE